MPLTDLPEEQCAGAGTPGLRAPGDGGFLRPRAAHAVVDAGTVAVRPERGFSVRPDHQGGRFTGRRIACYS